MSKTRFINNVHVEGYLYDADLSVRTTGENSKNPGTPYITGNIVVVTDEAHTNSVTVRFGYVAPNYPGKNGNPPKANPNYALLNSIVTGEIVPMVHAGVDPSVYVKVRVDGSFGLSDFVDKADMTRMVSSRSIEGSFIHVINDELCEDTPEKRSSFEVDMVMTGVRHVDADPDKGTAEKVVVKGAVFDFRKSLLPMEFSVYSKGGMAYFEDAGISASAPLFTKIRGINISETTKRVITEESAFDGPSVREVSSSRKDAVITWAQPTPYLWDDESTITAEELKIAMQNREIYLAGVKQRAMESNSKSAFNDTPSQGGFNF